MSIECAGSKMVIVRTLRLIGAMMAAVGVSGCSGLGLQPPQTAFYDFGLTDAAGLPNVSAPVRVEVVAPSWLNGSAMQYRLAWRQPERRRTYAESRWAAPPADMLALSLSRALRGNGNGDGSAGAGSRCRLKIELDEFVQVFDTEQQNHVQLVVRAQLLPIRGESPLAGREFSRREPGLSGDAEGGVNAARVAVRGLAVDIAGWLDMLDRQAGQGLNNGVRCTSA